jgi:hypothetical protein
MSYEISPRRVVGVVNQCQFALTNQGFNHGEVIIGLAELIGRTIVQTAETPIKGADAAKVVIDHLNRTLHAGYVSKGFNMGGDDASN